ncbi:hypothetical protein [Streptomyces sp. ISL-94]|uniref:hypothetical protein n=1 Tax=Streptomyces sp. ISL-94 TaxID=2819190 RepID=UPI001BEB0B72|nr:hypothetical protein [Streptomyces sp. ISL-94]MBT2480591.1 hypothetical protein [Streptomyces sp. ISL-94]
MLLRRAVPLSLLALLTSAGCVSVGPQDAAPVPVPVPVRGSVPPVAAPDVPEPLPLGKLPGASVAGGTDPEADPHQEPSPARPPAKAGRAPAARPAKPAATTRRPRAAKPASPHPRRQPAPPPGVDELCAAAGGAVPPSIVDLCLRQYGR